MLADEFLLTDNINAVECDIPSHHNILWSASSVPVVKADTVVGSRPKVKLSSVTNLATLLLAV